MVNAVLYATRLSSVFLIRHPSQAPTRDPHPIFYLLCVQGLSTRQINRRRGWCRNFQLYHLDGYVRDELSGRKAETSEGGQVSPFSVFECGTGYVQSPL